LSIRILGKSFGKHLRKWFRILQEAGVVEAVLWGLLLELLSKQPFML